MFFIDSKLTDPAPFWGESGMFSGFQNILFPIRFPNISTFFKNVIHIFENAPVINSNNDIITIIIN